MVPLTLEQIGHGAADISAPSRLSWDIHWPHPDPSVPKKFTHPGSPERKNFHRDFI